MNTLKKHWPWLLIGVVGLLVYVWTRPKTPVPISGNGLWVSQMGGKETILPNYSGL